MSQQSGNYSVGSGTTFINVPTPSGNNLSFFLNANDGNKLYAMRSDRSVFLVPTGVAPVDNKVSVSAADTTPSFLQPKITAGTNITLTVLNPGANETLKIDAATPAAPSQLFVFIEYNPGTRVLTATALGGIVAANAYTWGFKSSSVSVPNEDNATFTGVSTTNTQTITAPGAGITTNGLVVAACLDSLGRYAMGYFLVRAYTAP